MCYLLIKLQFIRIYTQSSDPNKRIFIFIILLKNAVTKFRIIESVKCRVGRKLWAICQKDLLVLV